MAELYSQQGCPGTSRARRYLMAAGPACREHDIGRDAQLRSSMRRFGACATPLVAVAERVPLLGFDPEELEAATAREGLPGGRRSRAHARGRQVRSATRQRT